MKNKKLVMIPGPTPVTREIQDQMGRETVAFGDPAFVEDFKGVVADLKTMWKTDGEAFVIAGTGTLGMEMALDNTLGKGDKVLHVSNGFFGDRFIEMVSRKGLEHETIQAEWGTSITPDQVEAELEKNKYDAVIVTHVDTSTGVAAPVAEIGEVLKKYPDTLYIVDAVCASAAERQYVDEMGIDVLITGSQKAFGVAPGLTILWASKDALAKRDTLGDIASYYTDFNKWIPIMHDPTKYFATPAVNLIWALKESVNLIKEEGIEERYDRHQHDAEAVQKALEALGFTLLADENYRSVALSTILYMDGVDDAEFRQVLAEEGVVVAGGLGPYAGKMFRLGHMGNIDTHTLISSISAIERTLYRVGIDVELGKGVQVLTENLLK